VQLEHIRLQYEEMHCDLCNVKCKRRFGKILEDESLIYANLAHRRGLMISY
jgi:hypothetical protein